MDDTSSSDRIRRQQPLFGMLTACLGSSFGLLVLFLVLPLLPAKSLNQGLFYTCYLFLSFAGSLLHFFLVRTAQIGEMTPRSIRQTTILAAIAYLGFSLADLSAFPDCFFPGFINITGVLAVAISAILDCWFRFLLFSRQTIYALIAEARPESLMERFSKQQEVVFEAYRGMITLRQAATGVLVLGIVLTMALNYSGSTGPAPSITMLVFLASVFGIISLANTYAEEHRFYLFGVATPFRFQRIRQDWSYALVNLCLAISCLVAGQQSPLDARMIGLFLAWLASLLPKQAQASPEDLDRIAKALAPGTESSTVTLEAMPLGFSLPWLPWVLNALKVAGIIALVTGIIWFLLKPLFEKGFRPSLSLRLLWEKLYAFLRDCLERLIGFCRTVISFLRVHLEPLPDDPHRKLGRKEYLARLLKANGGNLEPNGHHQHRAVLHIYAEFLDWSLGLGVSLRLADTPGDVGEKTKKQIAALIEANDPGCLFLAVDQLTASLEQDLFSRNCLSAKALDTMRQDCSLLRMSRRRAASS